MSVAFPDEDPRFLARRTDPDTSHLAAEELARQEAMCHQLLEQYARYPVLSAEQASTAAGYVPRDGAWKRVSDLQRLGLIEDTGLRVVGSQGRKVRLLRITLHGLMELERRQR